MSRPFVKKRGHDDAELARLPIWSELPEGHPLDNAANKEAYAAAVKLFSGPHEKSETPLRLPGERFWVIQGVMVNVYEDTGKCVVSANTSVRSNARRVRLCRGGMPDILPSLLESAAKTIKRVVFSWNRGGPYGTPAKAAALCEVVAAVRMAGIHLEDPIAVKIVNSTARDYSYNPATTDVAKRLRSLDVPDARIVEYSGSNSLDSVIIAERVYSNGYMADLMVYARLNMFEPVDVVRMFDSVVIGRAVTHLHLGVRCRDLRRVASVCKYTPCLRSLRLEVHLARYPLESAVHEYHPFPSDSQTRLDELTMLRFDVSYCCDDKSCTSVGRVLKFICSRAPNITTFITDLREIPAYYNTVITQWLPEIPIAKHAEMSAAPLTGQCDFAKLLPNVMRIGLCYRSEIVPDAESALLGAIYKRLRDQHRHLCVVAWSDHLFPAMAYELPLLGRAVYDTKRLKYIVAWQQACLAVHLTCASAKYKIPVDVKQTTKMIRDLIGRTDVELAEWRDSCNYRLGWHRS